MTAVRCRPVGRAAVLLDGARLASMPATARREVVSAATALLRLHCEVIVIDAGAAPRQGPSQGRVALPRAPSLDAALAELAAAGIGPGLVVLLADAHSSAGRRAERLARLRRVPFRSAVPLLHAFVTARRTGRVPDIDDDPAWTIRRPHDELLRRVDEAVLTVGAGGFATRGAVEETVAGGAPAVFAAGVYESDHAAETLAPGPLWTALTVVDPPQDDERVLDLRTGVLARRETGGAHVPLRTVRFASAAEPGVVALRAESAAGRLVAGPPLSGRRRQLLHSARLSVAVNHADDAAIAAAARQHRIDECDVTSVERVAAYAVAPEPADAVGNACLAVRRAGDFDELLRRHRRAWAARWQAVDVRIPDDPDMQLAVRFALFQLRCNADARDELAVGARGLSGSGYRGHVFWDADAFVLPAMVAIEPDAARAMVEYRLRRLPAARRRARAEGRGGARFPWESAHTGDDVTPDTTTLADRLIQVETGRQEEHITADVAWAAARYLTWTGDQAARSELAPLLTETAAYWADRVDTDADGRGHIRGVLGPDEYHPNVDDNAYTNIMAAWNLRAGAAALAGTRGERATADRWCALADGLVDGFDERTGRHEQFAGYYLLERMLAADIARPPVAADLLLGPERVAATQLVKQPDVLMAHHLVPEALPPRSLPADLDFYLPRTAHGSSLSPATVASLLARAGRPDDALRLLRQVARLDLDDHSGATAGGLHVAALAGTWLAVLTGICGVAVADGVLAVRPRLPGAWPTIEVRFHCLGTAVVLAVDRRSVHVRTGRPLPVSVDGAPAVLVTGEACLPYRRPDSKTGQLP